IAVGLEIRENELLVSLAGLEKLTVLTGLLQLVNNPSLADLSALLGVTSIKGTLQIVNNPSLVSLHGLDNIDYATVNILTITDCGKLSDCSVPAICDYLNFGSNSTLAANATGCNSKREVISSDAACAPNFASQTKSLWKTEQGRWLLALAAAAVLAAIGAWFFYRQRQRTRLLQLRIAIAQDIHDEAGVGLTKIGLTAQVAVLSQPSGNEDLQQKLEAIVAETRNVSASLGEVLFAVNPRYDRFEAVQAWLREWSRRFLEDARMEVDFDFPKSKHDPVLPPEIKRNLLLICKEALNNAVKYSGSERVQLGFSLDENGRNYVLRVQVFGRGFSPEAVGVFSNGIEGMERRA
ncbi:MAG: histidine kinase, partial [Bacteroidota bacterium]